MNYSEFAASALKMDELMGFRGACELGSAKPLFLGSLRLAFMKSMRTDFFVDLSKDGFKVAT